MSAHTHSAEISHFASLMSELIKGPVQSIQQEASIREAAEKMTGLDIDSLVIIKDKKPVGIVTHTDLVKRVLALGKDTALQVGEVMTPQLVSIEHNRPVFEGLMLMLSHKIAHLLVMEGEKMAGMVSDHDWLSFQERHPVALFRAIEEAKTVKVVAALRRDAFGLVKKIFEEEGNADSLTRLVTEINDRVTETLIKNALQEMKEEGHGDPPVAFAWIAMGSEGRREQTSSTDQDNGLVFENVPGDRLSEVQNWFLQFAEKVVSGLEQCGLPRCTGSTMASNPELCLSLDGWHRQFYNIIADPNHETLLKASIYFDFRSLYGQATLVDDLWEKLLRRIERNKNFLRFLTENMLLTGRPPVSNWASKVRSLFGLSSPSLDIKRSALVPLIMATRILALACGSSATHSLDRLDVIEKKGEISPELADALRQVYDFFMLLRIRHDFTRERHGSNDSFRLKDMNRLQRRFLGGALQTVFELQDFVHNKFAGDLF